MVGPNLLPVAFPALRDRIADEYELAILAGFGGARVQERLAIFPALIGPRSGIYRGVTGRSDGRSENQSEQEQWENSCHVAILTKERKNEKRIIGSEQS